MKSCACKECKNSSKCKLDCSEDCNDFMEGHCNADCPAGYGHGDACYYSLDGKVQRKIDKFFSNIKRMFYVFENGVVPVPEIKGIFPKYVKTDWIYHKKQHCVGVHPVGTAHCQMVDLDSGKKLDSLGCFAIFYGYGIWKPIKWK